MTTSKLPQRAKAVCGIDLLEPSFYTEGRPWRDDFQKQYINAIKPNQPLCRFSETVK